MRLHVCRVICSHCGKTLALLLTSIVPYSQVSFADQARIVSCYENSGCYSQIMDETPAIDENCIHAIIRRFVRHWLQRLLSMRQPVCASLGLVQSCFVHFSRQFMQIKNTPNILFQEPT